MDTQVLTLKKIWKLGIIALVVFTLGFTALFVSMRSASACEVHDWEENSQEHDCDDEEYNDEECDSCGGSNVNTNVNTNENKQIQKQENNQEVNIEIENKNVVKQTSVGGGEVKGDKIPLKSPETGAEALGLFALMSAAPAGFALRRFGRGKTAKKIENLGSVARDLVESRVK